MTSSKRHRATSGASEASSSASTTPKVQRTEPKKPAHPLLCTLPPTCNKHPTPIVDATALERHYANYHAFVCQVQDCQCVFPDARLLEIHQTECHDPLAAMRQERGEKIFACHLATCNKLFQTPKARRLHLIQGHGYPKEYFFAVTNKGIGSLLRRWGDGASLVRAEWKPRDPPAAATAASTSSVLIEEDDEEISPAADQQDESVDALTNSLNALAIVPPAIRFGRGGKNGGFAHDQQSRAQRRGRARGKPKDVDMNVDPQPQQQDQALAFVPRGVRNRGRGGPK